MASDSELSPQGQDGTRGGGRRLAPDPRLLWILSALVLVAAVALTATLGRQAFTASERRASDAAAAAAAKQMVINFTSLDYRTFDQYQARVLEGSTGRFKEEWSKQADQLKTLVTDNQTVSAPTRTEVGLSSSDDDSAEAIVGTIVPTKNKAAPAGVDKTYRIALKLEKVAGTWKVSSLDFVG